MLQSIAQMEKLIYEIIHYLLCTLRIKYIIKLFPFYIVFFLYLNIYLYTYSIYTHAPLLIQFTLPNFIPFTWMNLYWMKGNELVVKRMESLIAICNQSCPSYSIALYNGLCHGIRELKSFFWFDLALISLPAVSFDKIHVVIGPGIKSFWAESSPEIGPCLVWTH